ncbi:hypothetical protein EMIT079MI2_320054 [Bacillus sp. IT-79MI2]
MNRGHLLFFIAATYMLENQNGYIYLFFIFYISRTLMERILTLYWIHGS